MYVHPLPSLYIYLEQDCEFAGPTCRGPISKQHAYKQAAFDPVIPIEVPESDEDEDVKPTISSKRGKTPVTRGKQVIKEEMEYDELEDSPKIKAPGRRVSAPRNAKLRAAAKPLFPEPDSDSDDSLDDFIVHTDSDEEEKDRVKATKARGVKVKRSRKYRYEDDDEFESDDAETEEYEDEDEKKPFLAREVDEEALKKPMNKPLASFLPSTKMLVGTSHLNI